MTILPPDDSAQLRRYLLQTDEQLAEKQSRVQRQIVIAYENGDDEGVRRNLEKDGEIIAARLLKNLYSQ